jgi:hypothetical protein
VARAASERSSSGAAKPQYRDDEIGLQEPAGFRERVAQQLLRSGQLPKPIGPEAGGLYWVHPGVRAALDAWTKGHCGHEALPVEVRRVLVKQLTGVAGIITVENGMERQRRLARTVDTGLTPDQRWAAHLLFDERLWENTASEIAKSKGRPYPPSRAQTGASVFADFQDEMVKLAAEPNPTKGAEHLSRRGHAAAAVDHLAAVHALEAQLIERVGRETFDADRRDIVSWFRDAVFHALEAGMRGQAARVKAWEPHALRGKKVVDGAKRARNREADERRWNSMAAAVADELAHGVKLTAAYEIVGERFGCTSRTVSAVWKRVRKS